MPLISPSILSTLAWDVYPKSHMHIGRQFYLNFPNSVTIVIMYGLAGEILILQYPILIYNTVAYCNLSSCCIVFPILGDGYGFLTNFFLLLRQFLINLTVSSFLVIINTVLPFWIYCTVVSTFIFTIHLSSLKKFYLLILGTG